MSKNTNLLILLFSIIINPIYALSGYVTDTQTGEALIGANLYLPTNQQLAISNTYGYYSINTNNGNGVLIVSYIGYKTDTITYSQTDVSLNISLLTSNISIQEIEVTTDKNIQLLQSNKYTGKNISIKQIRTMPLVFGEADIVKAIQLQPGVKTLGDGSSGMFVRGGSSDQNLILIDEASVYNASHLMGLVSVFNPDALNDVTFYKSNLPAQYGSRCGALLDCKLKEGNKKQHHFSTGINTLGASLLVNGPIIKDKSSYLLSLRGNSWGMLLVPTTAGDLNTDLTFYDINFKTNTTIGKKDRLYLSVYKGVDKNSLADGLNNTWDNTVASIRWNRSFGTQWYSNVSFITSEYTNKLKFSDNKKDYMWRTGVKDLSLKINLTQYRTSNNQIKLGLNSTYHQFTPGVSNNPANGTPNIDAIETAVYAQQDLMLNQYFGLNYGLRFSLFNNLGKATYYQYDEIGNAILQYNDGGIYHTDYTLEPRVSLSYKPNQRQSLKLAYAHNAQYVQVLDNNTLSYTSLETWFPVNKNIAPLRSHIVSLGWFVQLQKSYVFSAEAYYKKIDNVIDYVGHAQLVDNPYVELETRSGKEKAYGVEFSLAKKSGKLTGEISYTYSRALQTIKGINNGSQYSSRQDIPHDFRITAQYRINKFWSLSTYWTYQTGRPVTVPSAYYNYNTPYYTKRNGARFPSYHRLDLSLHYSTKAKNKRSYWDFSVGIYNVYNRTNPIGYSYYSGNGNGMDEYKPITFLNFTPNFSIRFHF